MNNIAFVSAQPDIPYFHWQCKLYIHNFLKLGIKPENIHVLFAMVSTKEPTIESLKLKDFGVNVYHYSDTRKNKNYIPSLRPMVISKWLQNNPEFSKCYFYHDSDIIFRKLPDFDSLIQDDVNYVSDTISYLGYDYIEGCCKRYESKYERIPKSELLYNLSNIVAIPVELIKINQNNSGGAQYLLKDIDHKFWDKVFVDCTTLYEFMKNYDSKYPIPSGGIQIWTADMWAVIWNIWVYNKQTKISKELDFSFATDNIQNYEKKNIFHLAGVTDSLKHEMFFKGEYINVDPIEKLKNNSEHFNYIKDGNATIHYVELMKDFIKSQSQYDN